MVGALGLFGLLAFGPNKSQEFIEETRAYHHCVRMVTRAPTDEVKEFVRSNFKSPQSDRPCGQVIDDYVQKYLTPEIAE